MIEQINQGLICPYCFNATVYVDSSVIYGRSYGMIYLCSPCDAYVGVHKSEPTKALGRLADEQLRFWKKAAHAAFDPIWKDTNKLNRSDAYAWLSKEMNLDPELTHIGMFDIDKCQELIEICKKNFL